MGNSIRTPRQGKTASSRRIAEAVDNEEWQKFRLSLKGKSTEDKLTMLEGYYDNKVDECSQLCEHYPNDDHCDCNAKWLQEFENVKIRIDNYIKALCRGGQLEPGMTFDHFNDGCIRNHIKK